MDKGNHYEPHGVKDTYDLGQNIIKHKSNSQKVHKSRATIFRSKVKKASRCVIC